MDPQEETESKHPVRLSLYNTSLNKHRTITFSLNLIYSISHLYFLYKLSFLFHFLLDNGAKMTPKRCSVFSLIFIVNCISKFNLIRIYLFIYFLLVVNGSAVWIILDGHFITTDVMYKSRDDAARRGTVQFKAGSNLLENNIYLPKEPI